MAQDNSDSFKLIKSIQNKFDANPSSYFTETEALTQSDLVLLATLIQIYGYADLNARRIIDYINGAALGPAKQNGAQIQDAQVYEKLTEAAKLLPDGELKVGLIETASTFELHVQHRHHFAHWAARRVKGHEAFVMFTYNARQAIKQGFKPEPDYITHALVSIEPIKAQLQTLRNNEQWLAEQAAQIFIDFDALKLHFDNQREAERLAKYEAGKFKGRGRGGPQNRKG